LLSKWPPEARKEAKEGREGKEINHNLFGEYTRKIIGVSGKLRNIIQPFFIMKRLSKGCFGKFWNALWVFPLFLMGKVVLTYDQLELRPALANELSS
jgi:hypothetical protein